MAMGQIINGSFVSAVYLLTGSVILDGFDGTVARLTNTESKFGVQLDSLVDAVAFGVVTGLMVYMWGFSVLYKDVGKIIGFIFLSAGIIRLARFNVLKDAEAFVSNVFIGLPIPLGALCIGSVILVVQKPLENKWDVIAFSAYVVLISVLMISNLKFRTLKRIKSKNNLLILFLLAIVIALSIIFFRYTIPAISFLYLLSPLIFYFIGKGKKKHQPEIDDDNQDIPLDEV